MVNPNPVGMLQTHMITLETSKSSGQPGLRDPSQPTARRLVGLVFLLAVVARLTYCATMISPDRAPAIHGNDDWQYDYYAVGLVTGRGIANEDGSPTAQRMPGYPLLLAGVYAVFGHSYLAVRLLQCLLGGASCILLYLLAQSCFSRRVGLVSSALLAVYPMHVWLSGELLSENLTVPGALLVLLALRWAWAGGHVGRWALAGLAAGGVGLVHPIVAGLGIALAGTTFLSALLARERRWWRPAVMAVVLAAPLAGWMTRNQLAVGRFALSSLGGATFLGANNVVTATHPRYYGFWISEWDVPGTRQQMGHVRDEVQRGDLFWQFALGWLRDHPEHWMRLVAFKLVRFYSPFLSEWRSLEGAIYLASYGTLLPFIITGLWGVCRRGWAVDVHAVRPLLTILAYYTAIVLVFWGAPRFRLTIEPVLIALAAVSLVRLATGLRDRMPIRPTRQRCQLSANDV